MQLGRLLEAVAKDADPAAARGSDITETPVLQTCDCQSLLCKGERDTELQGAALTRCSVLPHQRFAVVGPGCRSLMLFLRVFLASSEAEKQQL